MHKESFSGGVDDDLAARIAQKRAEIEASGLCQWKYAEPPKIFGPWWFFGGRIMVWIEATWPYEILVRRGRRQR